LSRFEFEREMFLQPLRSSTAESNSLLEV